MRQSGLNASHIGPSNLPRNSEGIATTIAEIGDASTCCYPRLRRQPERDLAECMGVAGARSSLCTLRRSHLLIFPHNENMPRYELGYPVESEAISSDLRLPVRIEIGRRRYPGR